MSEADWPAVRRAFRGALLRWFSRNRRDLPWRTNRTPYRVWLSELMLQQTRVDQVIPYFHRFTDRYPTVEALAAARVDDVLKLWEGLGYYARARNALATAKHLVDHAGGMFPPSLEGLRALPGIGPYTAAAVGSLAFGIDAAVLDGNVARVLARVFAVRQSVKAPATVKRMQQWLDDLLPSGKSPPFNEAMMELGALVCTPRNPRCKECPLAPVCRARREGDPESYPVKPAKRKIPHRHVGAGIIIDDRGRVLIAQRPADRMLGGLWEFPGGGVEPGESLPACIRRELKEELGIVVRVGPRLSIVHHAFSHFTMDLHGYWVRIRRGRPRAIECAAFRWVPRPQLRRFAFPRADIELLRLVEETTRFPRF